MCSAPSPISSVVSSPSGPKTEPPPLAPKASTPAGSPSMQKKCAPPSNLSTPDYRQPLRPSSSALDGRLYIVKCPSRDGPFRPLQSPFHHRVLAPFGLSVVYLTMVAPSSGRESGLAATLIVTFRYAASLVPAILSALLAPICVSSFSAFISSCRLSFSRAAAFGMLS
jgi:hypothetical protein